MVSFVPFVRKAMILISSMQHSPQTDVQTDKPKIIVFYNSTKGVVDALDQKCKLYSTNRRTKRWLIAIFYATVNAFVLHYSFQDNEKETCHEFIKNLSHALVASSAKLVQGQNVSGRKKKKI